MRARSCGVVCDDVCNSAGSLLCDRRAAAPLLKTAVVFWELGLIRSDRDRRLNGEVISNRRRALCIKAVY